MKTKTTNVNKPAQIISVIGHPFVLLSLTVMIAAIQNEPPARAFSIITITVLATVFPILFIIRRNVVSGKWSDHDVSVAKERSNFYPIVLMVTAFSLVIFYLLDFPRSLLLGVLISLALLVAAWLINGWTKISLHVIFAVYFAVSLMAVSYWIGLIFFLIAVAVGWSRLQLERHSLVQVLSGAALGAVAGIILLRAIGLF